MSIKLWLAGGLLLALLASHSLVYVMGKRSVYEKLAAENIEILRDGKKIDDKVLQADDAALCGMLGGCL